MSDVMAIVAKAVFEKAAGKSPALGQPLGLDRYVSANKGLQPLAAGGRLFLVTVRPPDEALWLVAILESPTFSGAEWVAKASSVPMVDISALKSQLTFESGKGLPTAAGTLGMSLQTPRVLTAADSALLLAAAGGASGAAAAALASSPPAGKSAASSRPAAVEDPAAALVAAVLAAPDDDGPRRAIAAHWRRAGEPRGELIELELRLPERLSRHLRLNLLARRRQLLEAHAARFWPWKLAAHRHRKGFLSAISIEAGQLATAAKVFAAEPVTELTVTELDEDSAAELAKAPWLARVSHLIVRGPLGDEGLAALVKSRHLAGLTALNLSSNELSGEGLAALGKQLPALRRLVLTNNPIGDEGLAALAQWKHLAGLRTLYTTACELSEEGLGSLLTSGQLGALEKWTLSGNELGDAGAKVIASHAAQLPRLSFLELKNTELGDAGSKALAAARLPAIRILDVSDNRASYPALAAAYGQAALR